MVVARSSTHQEREIHLSWNTNSEGILLFPPQYKNDQSVEEQWEESQHQERERALEFVYVLSQNKEKQEPQCSL
jgi:hypothetical protein